VEGNSNLAEEMPIFKVLDFDKVEPYQNSIPLVDIQAAAGNFSENQLHSELTWVELPQGIKVSDGDFICKVVGESMNKRIPNGAFCLFKRYTGGSRNGLIVLVESTSIQDADFGSGYTVKEYESVKNISEGEWTHESIILKPLSTYPEYSNIVLEEDELVDFKVVGVFDRVIE
jgi:SOS-response transcriptional repressor LexA